MLNKISSKNKGILCILSAAFCFALMNFFVKAAGDIPFFEKAFFRNAVAAVFAAVILVKDRVPVRLDKESHLLVLGRSIAGSIGVFCNFYAIDHLNISDASMLNKLSPFFAILFSIWLLGEMPRLYQLACVFVALLGTLFILKPGVSGIVSFPALMGFCGGVGAGLAYTFLRKASGRGLAKPFIIFYFSAFTCICCLVPSSLHFVRPDGRQLASLLLAGLSATGGQFSITAAYSYAPASQISVYDYSQILFAGLLGYLFLNEVPDGLSLLGYVIIIGASILMFLLNKKTLEV